MSKNRSKWAIGFVLVLAFCTSVYAKGGHWTYLGDSHVDGSVDHDSIKVAGRTDLSAPSNCGSATAPLILSTSLSASETAPRRRFRYALTFLTADTHEPSICQVTGE